ncbi:MAG TPA: triphosphoribosyl-dephospho-CoA synthase, partial [Limnobacter sp.]|nr:triphosphoribosyl-dephospho-CoA synthase [Limnobacter sp.]
MNNWAQRIDDAACQALRQEVDLPLKPGLVCPDDPGSHNDMDLHTFMRSVDALQGYFHDCFNLGAQGADFRPLQLRGVQAERAMLAATQGVNTHKGAIFLMGLLSAAAGVQWAEQGSLDATGLGRLVQARWGVPIVLAGVQANMAMGPAPTHGVRVKTVYGLP